LSCQEKVAKKKSRPLRRPATPGPLRCSAPTGAAELGATPLRQSSPFSRCDLCCSTTQRASGKPNGVSAAGGGLRSVFLSPSCSAEQRSGAGGCRRALSEGQRPELRSRPAARVAQGSRQRRPRNAGSPFLWLLSFGEAKESMPAGQRRNPAPPPPTTIIHRQQHSARLTPYKSKAECSSRSSRSR
jgi:hypothetical protein